MSQCSISDFLTGMGTVLAGAAAVYGAWQGLKVYRESIMQKMIDTLIETEKQFDRHLPTLFLIESSYNKIRDVIGDPRKDSSLAMNMDCCLRFFYMFSVKSRLNSAADAIFPAYAYYFRLLIDEKERPELYKYIQTYFPVFNEIKKRHKNILG